MDAPEEKTDGAGESDQHNNHNPEPDLKTIRESKGLSLNDIFERTRISLINLEAIENGAFHLLPSPVITRSFIKTYAKTTGVDDSLILTRYEQYIESLKAPVKNPEVKDKEPSETVKKKYKLFLWGILILIAIGMIAYSISSYKSMDITASQIGQPVPPTTEAKPAEAAGLTGEVKSESADQANPSVKPEERDLQSKGTLQTAPSVQDSADRGNIQQNTVSQEMTKQPPAPGGMYTLIIEAKEFTWIRLTADKNRPQEILLKRGERIEHSASSFVIDIGNAGGTNVTFQGKPMENLGRHGQVVHLKLP
jgi:cytoskeleton protein RodZ